jgi:hypothetical protein
MLIVNFIDKLYNAVGLTTPVCKMMVMVPPNLVK